MHRAIELAEQAAALGEVPIGAIVVRDDQLLGGGFNRRESQKDGSCHAEIEALRAASSSQGDWRLDQATIVITMEPCLMCFGAIVQSRISTIVYGCQNQKNPNYLREIYSNWPNAPKLIGGVLENQCVDLLSDFFAKLR
jgi:tRNA(adenine34) deaminase